MRVLFIRKFDLQRKCEGRRRTTLWVCCTHTYVRVCVNIFACQQVNHHMTLINLIAVGAAKEKKKIAWKFICVSLQNSLLNAICTARVPSIMAVVVEGGSRRVHWPAQVKRLTAHTHTHTRTTNNRNCNYFLQNALSIRSVWNKQRKQMIRCECPLWEWVNNKQQKQQLNARSGVGA